MKKVINFRPIFLIGIIFAFGILAGYYFIFDSLVVGIIISSLVLLCLALFIFINKKHVSIIFAIVSIVAFSFGLFNFYIRVNTFEKATLNNQYYNVSARICEISIIDEGNKFILDDVKVSGDYSGRVNHKIALYCYGDCDADIGDNIIFSSYLYDYSCIYDSAFSPYNIADNIKFSASANAEDIAVGENYSNIFMKGHKFIRNGLRIGLSDQAFDVGYALILGNAGYMDDDVLTSFRSSGVAHIFAVSGLHIGFMATVVSFVLKRLRIKGFLGVIITAVSLFFYSGICGFSSSSIRASIMVSICVGATFFGKKYDSLSAVGLAGLVVLIVSPLELFCAGFLLSFGVVLGIVLLSNKITYLFRFLPNKISSSLGTVISAQLAGIPISIFAFGNFSLIAVAVNIIFIPLVGVVYILTFITSIFVSLTGLSFPLFISNCALKIFVYLITYFDYSIFLVYCIVLGVFVIAYYLVMLIVAGLFNIKGIAKGITVCVLSVVFVGGSTFLSIENNTSNLCVIGSEELCSSIVSSQENYMIVNEASGFKTNRILRAKSQLHIDDMNYLIITNGDNDNDVQNIMTNISHVFNVKNVYYYGGDNTLQLVLEKCFPNTNFYSIDNQNEITTNDYSFSFICDGYGVKLFNDNNSMAFFSEFGDSAKHNESVDKDLDYVVCVDYLERIESLYNPKNFLSYLNTSNYKECETKGNVYCKI